MSETLINSPRSLRSPDVCAHRRSMLHEPHIAALTQYVAGLRRKHVDWEFQDFDPSDGGCEAEILFLLEKPGPMTSAKGKGSGFISRDNDDPTAEAVFRFMEKAEIPRKRTLQWNVIPGWNGRRKVTATERVEGVRELCNLLPLLPRLRVVVLVGTHARRAEELMRAMNLKIYKTAHPSPIVRATRPTMWNNIAQQWKAAYSEEFV